MEVKLFTAEWCSNCSSQKDILSDLDSVEIESIDVDEQDEVAREYNVRSLPTLVLEGDGESLERWAGVTQLEELEEAIERHS